jgi:hypothetical protein
MNQYYRRAGEGMSANTTVPVQVPRIQAGRIVSLRSLREGLDSRPPLDNGGPSATVVYDDQGNIHLSVVQPDRSGGRAVIYSQNIGQVPTPAAIAPGTTRFGDALEPLILTRLSQLTGQLFRSRRWRPGDLPVEGEMQEVSPRVHRWAIQARQTARDWRSQGVGPSPSREGWVNSQAAKMAAIIDDLTGREIDIIIGALTALERIIGKTPNAVNRFRSLASRRFGLP